LPAPSSLICSESVTGGLNVIAQSTIPWFSSSNEAHSSTDENSFSNLKY
jgi:hypothetical protein